MMQPQVATREAFAVMGVATRGNPSALDYNDIWCRRFEEVHERLKPLRTEDAYYGVYFGTGGPGVVEMIAGVAVASGGTPLEGTVLRELGAATYLVFPCTMGTIGQTWQAIEEWLPGSAYNWDDTSACFERFPGDTEDQPDAPLSVFVPVLPKGEEG